MTKYLSTSWRLLRENNIKSLFDGDIAWRIPFISKTTDGYIGWGKKQTGIKAVQLANKNNSKFYLLEDGFLRSLGPRHISKQALSIIIDDIGIYYDSTKPSKLENLILGEKELDIDRAKQAIKFLIDNNLSKYNHAPECSLKDIGLENNTKPILLLIDQTYADASVIGAQANEQSFQNMINDALKMTDYHILVKVHPEVIAGRKKGYLYNLVKDKQIQIISDDFNPISLLKHVNKVFTVSSQMGFDALLLNKPVTCYGVPFYSGWGLTTDKITCERRSAKRSLEHIFAAAYFEYCKYINPFTNQKSEFEDIAEIINLQKQVNDDNREPITCLHMKPWKIPAVNAFLSYNSTKPFHTADEDKAIQKGNRIFAWAAHISASLEQRCKDNNVELVKVEDGFIRSQGLGANFKLPYSLAFDDVGIYYNSKQPSRMENLLNSYKFDDDILAQATNLISIIKSSNISKYNLRGHDESEQRTLDSLKDLDKKIILIPGQVDDDKSIIFGTETITNSFDLLKEVRANNPNKYIIFKPHPDVLSGQRKKYDNIEDFLNYADCIISNTDILELIDLSDEVHVLTSLTGFEALIRNKPVYCYGMPFYAGWGLTTDSYKCDRRTRKLSLNELAATTLILYPNYIHPKTLTPCSPEYFINSLNQPIKYGFISHLRIYWGKIKRGLKVNG